MTVSIGKCFGFAVLFVALAGFAQTTPPAATSSAAQTAAVSITQGPTIQYADDEFAVVTWTTDQPSGSRIEYGKDASTLKQVAEDGHALSLHHQVDLHNLQPNTTYYFRVDSGQGAKSTLLGFQTAAVGAQVIKNQKPFEGAQPSPTVAQNNSSNAANATGQISITSGPTIQYLDDTTAVISWTTNVPASNTLYYGPDRNNLLYTGGTFQNSVQHRVHLAELKPNTRYYFEFDEGSNRLESFQTVFAGARPLYDQNPVPDGTVDANSATPQLTRRDATNARANEVQAGTEINATLQDELSTKTSHPGDRFTAIVMDPVRDGTDRIVIPIGSRISGQISESEQGRMLPALRGRGKLNLRFTNVTLPSGVTLPISATLLSLRQSEGNGEVNSEGEVQSVTKASTAAEGAGVGAGIGTIAGFIIGGPWKGLAIGALAGGGYILGTKGKDVDLPENTTLRLRLDNNLFVGK